MAAIDNLRNNLIDKLFTISNKEYLVALNTLIDSSPVEKKGTVKLTSEQILMLQLSDHDIINGKLISREQLDKDDLAWLKEM